MNYYWSPERYSQDFASFNAETGVFTQGYNSINTVSAGDIKEVEVKDQPGVFQKVKITKVEVLPKELSLMVAQTIIEREEAQRPPVDINDPLVIKFSKKITVLDCATGQLLITHGAYNEELHKIDSMLLFLGKEGADSFRGATIKTIEFFTENEALNFAKSYLQRRGMPQNEILIMHNERRAEKVPISSIKGTKIISDKSDDKPKVNHNRNNTNSNRCITM